MVIPTYRRAEALLECLRSLAAGSVVPDEIIIVGRREDEATRQAIEKLQSHPPNCIPIHAGWVDRPGHIPPVEEGVRLSRGEIVTIVDDDVIVGHGWLARISGHFKDRTIGVVGGPAPVPGMKIGALKGRPGCMAWYGKTWGNLAFAVDGLTREVDSVCEGNSAWRGELVRQVHFDPLLNYDDAFMYGLDLCLQAKQAGFRVVFDPEALVQHNVKPRTPELDRADRAARAYSYCRNYTYILLKWLPVWRKAVFLAWWFGVGDRSAPGAGILVLDALAARRRPPGEGSQAFAGKVEGIRQWLAARGTGAAGNGQGT